LEAGGRRSEEIGTESEPVCRFDAEPTEIQAAFAATQAQGDCI
jgi:hypothetical protein